MSAISLTRRALARFAAELDPGAGVLEFGSGRSTGWLSDRGFRVVTIEHDRRFLYKAPAEYVYAPMDKRGFYPDEAVRHAFLRAEASRLRGVIIDGPPKKRGADRSRMMRFAHRLADRVVLIDDVGRPEELALLRGLQEMGLWTVAAPVAEGGKQWALLLPRP